MRILLFMAIIYQCTSCQDKSAGQFITIDFGGFTLVAPAGWNKLEIRGIDSYVGGLSNGIDTLIFDFGDYSYDFRDENPDKQLFAVDTVNGKIVSMTKPRKAGDGTIGIYINHAYDDSHFNLIGSGIHDEQTVFEIFRSIRFKDSDTTVNAVLFAQKFKQTKYPSVKTLFVMNCAGCHSNSDQTLVGPGLTNIDPHRFFRWFFDTSYAYTPNSPNDSYGTGYHRSAFYDLSREDVEALIRFSEKK